MAETAVSDAADEISANEPFAKMRLIWRRERMGKLKRGSSGHLIFSSTPAKHNATNATHNFFLGLCLLS
jgi:hypothetical protein